MASLSLDVNFGQGRPAETPNEAAELERAGFDGLWTLESARDPFLPIAAAVARTSRCLFGTGIAVAFARSPLTVAMQANDLQEASAGRFILGLGSQVRAHIERRFSTAWSHPAARMREYVLAVRAVWRAWHEGERLDFRGRFYTHTLMTPAFSPPPNPHGPPPIYLAAVGEQMVVATGEVADGLACHPLQTRAYLEQAMLPALKRGRARAAPPPQEFTLSVSVLVATGASGDELDRAVAAVRRQIAFYGSTPAYAPVLACHGLDKLHQGLHRLSRQGEWDAMAAQIDDSTLELFAVVARPAEVRRAIEARYGELADRVTISTPYPVAASTLGEVAASGHQ